LGALTGLRFVAATGVVLFHAVPPRFPGLRGAAGRLVGTGFVGVSLFFVLSGFVLAYNYLEPATGALRRPAREFWWSRVARVYPVYLLALALSAPEVVRALRIAATPNATHRAVATLTLVPVLMQGWWPATACVWNCPGWSLSVEACFYLLFPFLGAALARRRRRTMLAVAAGAWMASLGAAALYLAATSLAQGRSPSPLAHGFWLDALKFNPVPHLAEFVLGVAAGIAFLRARPAAAGRAAGSARRGRLLAAATVAGTAALLALASRLPFVLLHTGLLAPAWVLLIYTLASGTGVVARLLGSAPLVRLGEASYALYLIHSPVDAYLGAFLARRPSARVGAPLELALYVVLSVALSLAIFRWVEAPARGAIRRRFA
jgi:peptidoglycan/LPS O-acetylase OafA/YrhL